jgi:hypothetical protein
VTTKGNGGLLFISTTPLKLKVSGVAVGGQTPEGGQLGTESLTCPFLISPPPSKVTVCSGGVWAGTVLIIAVGGSVEFNVTVISRLLRLASLCALRKVWKTRSFTVRTLCLLMNASQLGAAIEANIPRMRTMISTSRRVNPPSPFLDAVLLHLELALAAELCKSFNNIGGVFMVLSYCLSAGGDSEISFRPKLFSSRA